MNSLEKLSKSYLWFLYPEKTLFSGSGLYSQVKVTQKAHRMNLYTGVNNFLQTTYNPYLPMKGTYADLYLVAPWFIDGFDFKLKSLLILGLGGGVLVKKFNQTYKIDQITGVEIDPLIIELGKKYFDLNDANLITENCDAADFIRKSDKKFECIIVDAFKEDKFEAQMETELFIKSLYEHLTQNGVILINKLKNDKSTPLLIETVSKYFSAVYVVNGDYNLYVIGINNCSRRKTEKEVKSLLINVAKKYDSLKFFRNVELVY